MAKQTGVVSPLFSTQFMIDCSSKLPFDETSNGTSWGGCYGSISYNIYELVMKSGKVKIGESNSLGKISKAGSCTKAQHLKAILWQWVSHLT